MSIKLPYNTRRFTKRDKSSKQPVLIYFQTSTIQINLSVLGVILGVFYLLIYTCVQYYVELTVTWQNSKPPSCKTHAFLQTAISSALILYLSDCRFTFFFFFVFFLQDTGNKKPDYRFRLLSYQITQITC